MQQHVLPRHWIVALCGAVVLGSLGVLPASHIAAATIYTVNALTDTGAGAGTTGDLRYAINQVNAGSGGDTITFAVTGTITLTSTLTLAKDVTITGPGAASLAIDGGCTVIGGVCAYGTGETVFTVDSGVAVNLSGLTIQHGSSLANSATGGNGGGIATDGGTLTVTNVTLTGNTATNGGGIYTNGGTVIITHCTLSKTDISSSGGDIYASGGAVTVTDSTFSGGFASSDGGSIYSNAGTLSVATSTFTGYDASFGGAIYSSGIASVSGSTFTGNTAVWNNGLAIGGGSGGAIDSTGTLTVTTSTFTNNSAGNGSLGHAVGYGGAIAVSGTATITRSTFTGNHAVGGYYQGAQGGAITNSGTAALTNLTIVGNAASPGGIGGGIDNAGTMTVTNSTVVGNSADGRVGGIANRPECFYGCTPAGATNLTNTIVAQNTGGDLGPTTEGSFVGYFNLIADAATAGGFTDGVNGNIVGHPANLGTLGNNGGPTQTIPLLSSSPAIDHGAPVGQGPYGNTVPNVDQRGVVRPQGLGVDIGAFEWPTVTPLPAPQPPGPSAPGTPSPLPPPRAGGAGSGAQSGGPPAPLPLPRR